jgi:alkanesulfonate monooxygenase SsuD/methylene tetrahydromethanopterin reductase-like flavin-dependent oxidoreductase (luciferase family)
MQRTALPLFNANRFKLGIFCMNVSYGTTMTTAEGTLTPTWEENVRIAQAADAAGWEFLLPLGRWRGLGGQIDFNGRSFEVFTWASAIAALTRQIQVFATAHVPIWHPLLAAKLATTIDHVSSGRFGLNVVAGWNEAEFGMFGIEQRAHDDRYAVADEWMAIIKRLWTEEAPLDFEGAYYRLTSAVLQPKPLQEPFPVIVNAGQSATGMRFGARHADYSFQATPQLDSLTDLANRARVAAREVGKPELGILTYGPMVCRDTEQEVRSYLHHYVDERGDWQAARDLVQALLAGGGQSVPSDVIIKMEREFVQGWYGYPLFGTPEQIVDEMLKLKAAGIDGIALSWVDYEQGVQDVNEKLLPLMHQAGLRTAAPAPQPLPA